MSKSGRGEKRESSQWIVGSTNKNTCTYCPILINKFLGSKAIHTAALQHALCLCSMGKSGPLCFTSVFWLSHPHSWQGQSSFKKSAAVIWNPLQRPASWEELCLEFNVNSQTSQTAIYGCFKFIISSGIKKNSSAVCTTSRVETISWITDL